MEHLADIMLEIEASKDAINNQIYQTTSTLNKYDQLKQKLGSIEIDATLKYEPLYDIYLIMVGGIHRGIISIVKDHYTISLKIALDGDWQHTKLLQEEDIDILADVISEFFYSKCMRLVL